MPSRNSRNIGAPLDPFGIYGTRTQARLRASQKRRQSQNLLLILSVLGAVAIGFALTRWKREKTDVAPMQFEIGAAIDVAPIFAPATKTQNAALLIANRDGVLMRWDDIENLENVENNKPQKTILLRDDFPIHAPLLVGDKLFVPSESGVLTALLWRDKKVLWRKKFDDALSSQPTAFSIARAAPEVVPSDAPPVAPEVASPITTPPETAAPPVPIPPPAPSAPTSRQVVVAASDAGLLIATDVGSGQTLWRARMPAPIGNGLTSVEANGRARVLVPLLGGTAMRGGVWCLDGASGKVLWRFPKDARAEAIQFAPPLADLPGNRAYFGNDLGTAFSLNLTTGNYDTKRKIGWKSFVSGGEEDSAKTVLLRAAALLVETVNRQNQRLVIGGSDGVVRALAADTGSAQWRANVKAPVVALSRVKIGSEPDQVLVVAQSSQLFLLDAQTGQALRRLSSKNEIFVGAAISSKHIFAATENGAIHRFDLTK